MSIAKQLEKQFPEEQKRFSEIVGTEIWQKILDVVSDGILLSHIIFANDVLSIPPIKTFLCISHLENEIFDNRTKQCMGAVFGFLFCELLGYRSNENISCRVANLKTASKFIK